MWPTASYLWEKREKRQLHENCVRRSSIYFCHYYYFCICCAFWAVSNLLRGVAPKSRNNSNRNQIIK